MKKKDRNSFGGKLNSILWERDVTMTWLAETIGTAPTTVFHWVKENRPPTIDRFAQLADALCLSDQEVVELVNTFRSRR